MKIRIRGPQPILSRCMDDNTSSLFLLSLPKPITYLSMTHLIMKLFPSAYLCLSVCRLTLQMERAIATHAYLLFPAPYPLTLQ